MIDFALLILNCLVKFCFFDFFLERIKKTYKFASSPQK